MKRGDAGEDVLPQVRNRGEGAPLQPPTHPHPAPPLHLVPPTGRLRRLQQPEAMAHLTEARCPRLPRLSHAPFLLRAPLVLDTTRPGDQAPAGRRVMAGALLPDHELRGLGSGGPRRGTRRSTIFFRAWRTHGGRDACSWRPGCRHTRGARPSRAAGARWARRAPGPGGPSSPRGS